MNSQTYTTNIFISDFTRYKELYPEHVIPSDGVYVSSEPNSIIPSLLIENPHGLSIKVVNIEQNKLLFKNDDGTQTTQCECICIPLRKKPRMLMLFVELKYCLPKNIYTNVLTAIKQLKETCRYVFGVKQYFEETKYKRAFVVATPGVAPLDPFDACYFDQDDMLTLKKEYNANIFFTNHLFLQTPIHMRAL